MKENTFYFVNSPGQSRKSLTRMERELYDMTRRTVEHRVLSTEQLSEVVRQLWSFEDDLIAENPRLKRVEVNFYIYDTIGFLSFGNVNFTLTPVKNM